MRGVRWDLLLRITFPHFFHVKTKRGVTCYTDYKGMPQLPCYIHAIAPSKKERTNIEHQIVTYPSSSLPKTLLRSRYNPPCLHQPSRRFRIAVWCPVLPRIPSSHKPQPVCSTCMNFCGSRVIVIRSLTISINNSPFLRV